MPDITVCVHDCASMTVRPCARARGCSCVFVVLRVQGKEVLVAHRKCIEYASLPVHRSLCLCLMYGITRCTRPSRDGID